MKQINDIVREAMGFNKERGDTLSVANAPFTASEKSDNEIPLWKDPENVSFLKDILKYLLIAGIVAFLYLKVIQPSLKTMFPPPPEAEKHGHGEAEGGGFLGGSGEPGSRKKARKVRLTSISTITQSRSKRRARWPKRIRRPLPT